MAEKLGYHVEAQRLVGRDATGVCLQVLPDDESAVTLVHPEQGARVLLIPERKYGKRGSLRNISYEQRPDVAVAIHPAHGASRVLVFDPKNRLEGEVSEGLMPDVKPKKISPRLLECQYGTPVHIAGWYLHTINVFMPLSCSRVLTLPLVLGK